MNREMADVPSQDLEYWCQLAVDLRRQGRLDEAINACRRALEYAPGDARAWSELAHALRMEGQLEEAKEAADRALELDPNLAGAWFNLSAVLLAQGDAARGIEANRKALELKPDFAEAWSNLGGALGARGDRAGEIDAYRRALDSNPRLAPVWSNLGNAMLEAGRIEEAVSACRRAIELDTNFAAAWNNLGDALREHGQVEEAIRACERAVQLCPELAGAWNNLGAALLEHGDTEQSVAALNRALELQPRNALAIYNLGVTQERRQQNDAAVSSYRRALEIDSELATARLRLACMLLSRGDLAEGWVGYEWRWRERHAVPKRFDFTPWVGDSSPGRRLLIWAEQGIGDQILHASMIRELADSGLRITLEADPRLVSLMQRSFAGARVVPRTQPAALDPANFDCQSPLTSLGRWLRPSFDAFPRHSGYLKADPGLTEMFSARLRRAGSGMVVGVSWTSAERNIGSAKSAALAEWARILRVPGIRFVDLQYGDTTGARLDLMQRHGLEITHFDDIDLFNDLEALAALCAACDLVITVSNVTAHMAGALGKPVWLIAPVAKGRIWYWFSGRDDNPWYPSMRVFSQQTPGRWREPLDSIEGELAALVRRK